MSVLNPACRYERRFSAENILLTPPPTMSLEECITCINEDELPGMTPKAVRLRKTKAV